MGKKVVAEEVVRENLHGLFGSADVRFGLLLGQWSSDKAYLVATVPTPGDESDSSNSSTTDISTQWAIDHAEQVCLLFFMSSPKCSLDVCVRVYVSPMY